MVENDKLSKEQFSDKIDVLVREIADLSYRYPGNCLSPGYCLLTHAADLLILINECNLV